MMKKGTQAMLDAAKDDVTLLPFDTVFITCKNENSDYHMPDGVTCYRTTEGFDDFRSVAFFTMKSHELFHADITDLLPAKKSKPKKWQNGTQSQLDAAKDDARLIPKKTYFKSKYGKTVGNIVYVIDNKHNERANVLMFSSTDFSADFHNASDLEPIND